MYCFSVQVIKDEAENQRQVTMQLFFILLCLPCVRVTAVSPSPSATSKCWTPATIPGRYIGVPCTPAIDLRSQEDLNEIDWVAGPDRESEADAEVVKLEKALATQTSRLDYFYVHLEKLEAICNIAFIEKSQDTLSVQKLFNEVSSLQVAVASLNQTVTETVQWKDFLQGFFYMQTIFDNLFVVALLVSFFPLYVKVYRREWRIIKDEQRKEVLRKAAREEILHPHCGEKRDYTGFTRARVTRSSPADDTVLPPGRL